MEKLKQVLRWDKKELGLLLRHAHSAHTLNRSPSVAGSSPVPDNRLSAQLYLMKQGPSKILLVNEVPVESQKLLQNF